jgi:membrane protease YdiL (CAAX protease family)
MTHGSSTIFRRGNLTLEPNEIDPTPPSPPARPSVPLAVAPAWHTIVLVAAILALTIYGATRSSPEHAAFNRLAAYGFMAAGELAMLGWIVFGLRLRKTSIRSLLGPFPFNFRSIAADLVCALLFWVGSIILLCMCALAWTSVETVFTHRLPANAARQPLSPDRSPQRVSGGIAQLAPSNGAEIAAWALFCLVAGFAEEIAFRGYLQRQFTAWARGNAAAGILLSASIFGCAHANQGARGMFLLGVFGVFFGLLALERRALRPGIFAHCGHDFILGLALASLKSHP